MTLTKQQRRLLGYLTQLYENKTSFGITELAKSFGVAPAYNSVIVKNDLVEKVGHGEYVWKTTKPNIHTVNETIKRYEKHKEITADEVVEETVIYHVISEETDNKIKVLLFDSQVQYKIMKDMDESIKKLEQEIAELKVPWYKKLFK